MFNGLVWLNYEVNKAEIIELFCVNKEMPELKCEGSCHMKKMMLDEGGEEGEEPITLLPEIQLYVDYVAIEINQTEIINDKTTYYYDLYSFGFLDDVEFPPWA